MSFSVAGSNRNRGDPRERILIHAHPSPLFAVRKGRSLYHFLLRNLNAVFGESGIWFRWRRLESFSCNDFFVARQDMQEDRIAELSTELSWRLFRGLPTEAEMDVETIAFSALALSAP